MGMDVSINPLRERVELSVIESFKAYSPALVGDCYGRRNIMDPGIKPLNQRSELCGVAVTIALPPDDNLMLHAALNLAQEGDVLVVSTQGDMNSGVWGEIMTTAAMTKKLVGLVLDGSCRDSKWIRDSGWPLFCRGICARGSQKAGPGHINSVISCGRVVVHPGDIILGDGDGIMVIPADAASVILPLCEKKQAQERERIQNIKSGKIKPAWLDESLSRLGCKMDSWPAAE